MNPYPDATPTDALSPEGIARKQAMLAEMESAVRSRPRRRAARRAALLAAPCVLAAAALAILRTGPSNSTPPTQGPTLADTTAPRATPDAPVAPSPAPREPPARPRVRMVYVATDATVLDRYTAPPTPARVELLSDRELLTVLDELGMPAGMIKTESRATLAFHNVAPPEPIRTP